MTIWCDCCAPRKDECMCRSEFILKKKQQYFIIMDVDMSCFFACCSRIKVCDHLVCLQEICLKESEVVLCGGSESMSQAPYAVRNIRFGTKFGFDLKVCFSCFLFPVF